MRSIARLTSRTNRFSRQARPARKRRDRGLPLRARSLPRRQLPCKRPAASRRNNRAESFLLRTQSPGAGNEVAPARAADHASYRPEFLRSLFEQMVLIREFEDGVKFLFLEGSMPGTIHQCQGQEATAVGVCAALEATTSSPRPFAATAMHSPRA